MASNGRRSFSYFVFLSRWLFCLLIKSPFSNWWWLILHLVISGGRKLEMWQLLWLNERKLKYPFQREDFRRQILTYKDDPRDERIEIFIMDVDP